MKKSVLDLLLIVSGLIILFASFTSAVLADNYYSNVEIDLSKEIHEIEMHQEWEVSGGGDVILTTITEYKDIENIPVGTTWTRSKDRNIVIYDYERHINGSLDELEWFIEFWDYNHSGTFTATFPQYNATPNSRVKEIYKIGNHSKPAPVKEWWLGKRNGTEFWFPLDRYVTTVGITPYKEYRLKYSAKVILPHSFLPENQTIHVPIIGNKTKIQNKTAYIWFIHERNVSDHYLEGNNWIALVPPVVMPNEEEMALNPYLADDARMTVYYSRPDFIKWLFYIFAFAMLFSSILPFLKNKNEKPWAKIYGTFKICGAIWITQEGLISLLPSTRPSVFTLYDATIFIPISILGVYLLVYLFYQGWLWWRSRDDITVPF